MSDNPREEPYGLELLFSPSESEAASRWVGELVQELGGSEAELGVGFCSDEAMAANNLRYRQKNSSTDVLSFPSAEASHTEIAGDNGTQYLGDVLISVDTAKQQAADAGQSLAWEIQCLILHGLLHCLGHDHEQDSGEMDAQELELRDRWINDQSAWAIPEDLTIAPAEVGGMSTDSDGASELSAMEGENWGEHRRARAKSSDEGEGEMDGMGDISEMAERDAEDQTSGVVVPKFGKVALVGRPNAGKSTLMNRWLGEKLAIVSDKPQTTRHRIVGIHTEPRGQMVFLDTPGIHKPQHRLNRRMVKAASDALSEADVICLLVDASVKPGRGDEFVQELVLAKSQPKILLLNKIDTMKKSRLLPLIQRYSEAGFDPVIPISALDGDGAEAALEYVWGLLPEGPPEFDSELYTLQTERFLTAERIREKILERTRDELPFVVAVVIDQWEERDDGVLYIAASILVERGGQKSILIGKGGQQIKAVGTAAREDLEEFLGHRVFLDLFVRTEKGWREDPGLVAQIESYQMA